MSAAWTQINLNKPTVIRFCMGISHRFILQKTHFNKRLCLSYSLMKPMVTLYFHIGQVLSVRYRLASLESILKQFHFRIHLKQFRSGIHYKTVSLDLVIVNIDLVLPYRRASSNVSGTASALSLSKSVLHMIATLHAWVIRDAVLIARCHKATTILLPEAVY